MALRIMGIGRHNCAVHLVHVKGLVLSMVLLRLQAVREDQFWKFVAD